MTSKDQNIFSPIEKLLARAVPFEFQDRRYGVAGFPPLEPILFLVTTSLLDEREDSAFLINDENGGS